MLGEDSGIECDALDGAPGLHSARWAPGADQADALLERLAGEPNRRARMVDRARRALPGRRGAPRAGRARGRRSRPSARGEGGFGYDPIFIPAGYDRTVAELGDDWKRRNSHRAQAALALAAGAALAVPFARSDGAS